MKELAKEKASEVIWMIENIFSLKEYLRQYIPTVKNKSSSEYKDIYCSDSIYFSYSDSSK